jgi:hypothetical protein
MQSMKRIDLEYIIRAAGHYRHAASNHSSAIEVMLSHSRFERWGETQSNPDSIE